METRYISINKKWLILYIINILLITITQQTETINNMTKTIDNTEDNVQESIDKTNQKNRNEDTITYNNNITNKENESRNVQINNNNNSINLTNMFSESLQNNQRKTVNGSEIFLTKMEIDNEENTVTSKKIEEKIEQRELDDVMEYGLKAMNELLKIKEPKLYELGLYLDDNEPASYVANFGKPNKKSVRLTNLGFAALEASKKLAETYPENVSRQSPGFLQQSRLLLDECPLRGKPRCSKASRRYRTIDGTCNNLKYPWRGSSMLPMQRFLPPVYEDGIQSIRESVRGDGGPLPSARDISTRVHRDKNHELPTITLMFMQWGQFIDHDLTSAPKSRSFNGTTPRCCVRGGRNILPPPLLHPNCLPIEVSENDWFFGQFGIGCLEFIRSAPSTRINCDLGWREQLNQVTSYLDGSAIYGSDIETADSLRTFRNGKLQYGRAQGREPLQPPDPPNGELCRSGALTSDCFQGGDGRLNEQPGLLALHTTWLRYHNRLATILGQLNRHWSDEKTFQETRRIIIALVQHITYKEFLPIALGQEVMELFELNLKRKGYYHDYDVNVNPTIANAFGGAAFRFGHSLVQNSFVRTDSQHRPLFNNVSLHEEQENVENIWSFGSIDRLLLGFSNQRSQKRDEFICDELTNHLFQNSPNLPFGMDLAAINIQRGRDHGLPSYTTWREPCGLSTIRNWNDLTRIMNYETVQRFKSIYRHFDDIDLFSGGLAERPVRGGIIGPTFSCIIAQQFLNLRKGDRFWYENVGFVSAFTPAQLQQIRHVTLSHVLCQTMSEIETIQPFVFLMADDLRNLRLSCNSPMINQFDLTPWIEKTEENDVDFGLLREERVVSRQRRKSNDGARVISNKKAKKRRQQTTTKKPLQILVKNITTSTVETKYSDDLPKRPTFGDYYQQTNRRRTTTTTNNYNDVTYLFGIVNNKTTQTTSQKPFEVNIKIQYFLPTTTTTTTKPTVTRRKTSTNIYEQNDLYSTPTTTTQQVYYPIFIQQQPLTTTKRPTTTNDDGYNIPTINKRPNFRPYRPTYFYNYYNTKPTTTTTNYYSRPEDTNYVNRPTYSYNNKPNQNYYIYSYQTTSKPQQQFTDDDERYYYYNNNRDGNDFINKFPVDSVNDKLDFHSRLITVPRKPADDFIKISSVKGVTDYSFAELREETDVELTNVDGTEEKEIRVVDLDIIPSEIDRERWLIYNVTDDEDEGVPHSLQIAEIETSGLCTNELPRPITLNDQTKTDDDGTTNFATETLTN